MEIQVGVNKLVEMPGEARRVRSRVFSYAQPMVLHTVSQLTPTHEQGNFNNFGLAEAYYIRR